MLQPIMTLQAESFVCRRCRTNNEISHEAFDSAYHFHPEVEITLIEDSRGTRHVADSIEPYGPGDLVLLGANVPHVFVRDPRAAGEKPDTSLVVTFREGFMGAEFLARPEMLEIRRLLAAAAHGLHYDRRTADWVAPRLEKMRTLQGARRVALLLEVLARLARAKGRPLASGSFEKEIELRDLERLDRVLAHLAKNFQHDITLESAARVAALGPTSFSRWFKRATLKTFVECLTEIRLGHAYRQLTETGKNVTEIAFDCGFNSVSHFIHRFQRARGMAPGEFRRLARAGLDGG
jgi:AraC-like DNA-binding protein